MNDQISLYEWVRENRSIQFARIAAVEITAGEPGQEVLNVRITTEKTLWGEDGEAECEATITRPSGRTAQLKFPDPIWGRVTLERGATLFLVTANGAATPLQPIYAEDSTGPNDPVYATVARVLEAERAEEQSALRMERYLEWMGSDSAVIKLFAAQALAKDHDLHDVDDGGRIASSFASAFSDESDEYLRLSFGSWMWDDVYERSTPEGRVAILNSTIRAMEDRSPDIQSFSVDCLTSVDPEDLHLPGIEKTPGTLRVLQEQMQKEESEEAREEIKDVLEAIR